MPKARVLAVDDQRYFRELIEGLLVEEGYAVRTASSGEEALHILEREDFEIVITDLVMPGLDGSQLVERIKQRNPEQEIVMVTGVVDVKTAVEAMKQGATDYILKPFDRGILAGSLEKILERRRLREEHSRLMAENLEFMGVLSLYERVSGLYSTLAVEPLAERLIEGLCLETRAQGGVLWMAGDLADVSLELRSARGIIRVDEERVVLDLDRFAEREREALLGGRSAIREAVAEVGRVQTLWVPLCHAGSLLAVARLSDKLDAECFDERDRAAAEKFAALAAAAVANALRFRSLERRSFRDPVTRAYTHAYFEDAVRNEIQKSSRFGHRFSLMEIDIDGIAELRRGLPETRFEAWLAEFSQQVGGALRSTDLLATCNEACHRVLLPETDALAAAVLEQRVREAVADRALLDAAPAAASLSLSLASVSYPVDGSQLDGLIALLQGRAAEYRENGVDDLLREDKSFEDLLDKLLEEAHRELPGAPEQIARFLLEDLASRPRERGLLLAAPGRKLMPIVREGLERLTASGAVTEAVLVAERPDTGAHEAFGSESSARITWIEPHALANERSFLLYYGDGPAYAMSLASEAGGGSPRFFHTSDRGLVEHLVFRLQRDLGIPMSA